MVLLFRRHPPKLENHMFSHPKPPPKPETPSKSTVDSVMSPMPKGSLRSGSSSADNSVKEEDDSFGIFDVRLNLKGKSRGSLVLELNLAALSTSRSVFMNLIVDCQKSVTGSAANLCRIEVPEVENLNVFRDAIKLIFDDDIPKRLLKIGVYRSIDILENEEEEKKLRSLFNRFKLDDDATRDIPGKTLFIGLGSSMSSSIKEGVKEDDIKEIRKDDIEEKVEEVGAAKGMVKN
ncbi:hypothetical protein TEA_018494 [Camellia sinensis var. sinensis]|uniref:BTB domain-containing protein n=1 Tax=Camellia sinensis var. sinensis TaxID=542762 RepID=A0A4S4E7I2_CAMSN|nr:hypothetical protein TEA_018494 [Camellia sinensis var. sinensis]